MRKASTVLLEQGIQTPSPAPDLIPAENENQPRTHIEIGTSDGGTSESQFLAELNPSMLSGHLKRMAVTLAGFVLR
jgi:hypothetical protein